MTKRVFSSHLVRAEEFDNQKTIDQKVTDDGNEPSGKEPRKVKRN